MIDKLKSRLSKKEKGFTLIELLVVIAIIAILVLIVVVVINPAQRISDANDATAESDVRSVASGLGACITGQLADGVAAADVYSATALIGCANETALVTLGYMANIPNTVTGNIAADATNVQVCVWANGGGTGRIARWQSSTGALEAAGDGAASCP